jgi:DedD protein
MGLLSIFQRKSGERVQTPASDASPDAVQEARTRARRRLIGAAVLVVIGVIGFPLLFETQPRPIPVDIPIEIPRKDGAPALAMPIAKTNKPAAAARVEATPASTVSEMITETPAQTQPGREALASQPASAAADKPTPVPAKLADAPAPKHASTNGKAATTTAAPTVATANVDSQRAQALLEGKPADNGPSAKDTGRFVVQVGAFADASAARETRQRVEKLGLKTYTQVAQTSAGSRIRVRVGPFSSRDEADRAQAKIKAAGAPAVVLTL